MGRANVVWVERQQNPLFTVLNKGKIIAQADEWHGGNIYIKSEHFVTSPDSLVSASSRLGKDGEVKIDSPDMDMEGFLVEIGTEELPPKALQTLSEQFSSALCEGRKQEKLDYNIATPFAT
ncbi:hypothetical protein QUF54_05255, partial [Candidatus Marithioploca araucensis]|nr:hypothetical protein [Candidatus Marithioploca araucensis]